MPTVIDAEFGSFSHTENCVTSKLMRGEELTPRAFLDLVRRDPGSIRHAKIVAPRPGTRPTGRIAVEYAVPRVRRARNR